MIERPTVIIFGAGASQPYGFPLGSDLLEIICNNLDSSSNEFRFRWWVDRLSYYGFSPDNITEFRAALFRSQQSSVDSFLEHRPEFLEIGKIMIAETLIPFEVEERLLSFEARKKGCYQYIFRKLTENTAFNAFPNNNLTVITFNYDRTFELNLMSALISTYGKPESECAHILESLKIIHVHGSLGKLPWQTAKQDEIRQYTSTLEPSLIRASAKQINIVSEGKDSSYEFRLASHALTHASYIYFLGFGYNPVNLSRLGIQNINPHILSKKQDVL
jgi:hypothetical protein